MDWVVGCYSTGISFPKKNLCQKNLIRKKFDKLKILGKGDIKEKLNITTDFISKSARSKIEKAGGSINIIKPKNI